MTVAVHVSAQAWMAKPCARGCDMLDCAIERHGQKKPCEKALQEDVNGMWYVMQVISGREGRTALMMERSLSGSSFQKCFIPMRRRMKKYHGTWHEVTEKLFPGYVFLVSDRPWLLYDEVKNIPAMTKLLGSCEEYFTPLSESDVRLLENLQDMQDVQDMHNIKDVGLSRVIVGEDGKAQIVSGPLKNLKGQVRKIDLHKRIAVVETEFMGNRSMIHLGIEIVKGS